MRLRSCWQWRARSGFAVAAVTCVAAMGAVGCSPWETTPSTSADCATLVPLVDELKDAADEVDESAQEGGPTGDALAGVEQRIRGIDPAEVTSAKLREDFTVVRDGVGDAVHIAATVTGDSGGLDQLTKVASGISGIAAAGVGEARERLINACPQLEGRF